MAVLVFTLACFVGYGLWRSRGTRDLGGYLASGHALPWPMVALTIMATQASAITFSGDARAGVRDGMRSCSSTSDCRSRWWWCARRRSRTIAGQASTPRTSTWRRASTATARTLAAGLFLIQRGLAAGITIYAPALVLSVLFGWPLGPTCVLLGALVVGVHRRSAARAR